MPPKTEGTPESGAEVAAGTTTPAPDSGSWQVPGQPEREKREQPAQKVRRRRRAERSGTNPSAEDLPDVVPPREDAGPGDSPHDRWLREQRPPHWE